MIRHPRYLEIPWDMHSHHEESGPHRTPWLVVAVLILLALFLIGVGLTAA
jgi:hypothetical protein